MPIHRITRPKPIDPQNLEDQRGRSGKISRHEAALRVPVRPAKARPPRPVAGSSNRAARASSPPISWASGLSNKIRGAVRRANALIRRRGEARISEFAISRTRRAATSSRVVSVDALSTTTTSTSRPQTSQSVETTADLRGGIPGHDDDCDTGHVSMRRARREPEIPAPVKLAARAADLPLGGREEIAHRGDGRPPGENRAGASHLPASQASARAVAQRHQAPQELPGEMRPEAGAEQRAIVVPRDQHQLIARNQAHHARIPAPQRRAAMMPGDGLRNVYAREAPSRQRRPRSTSSR